MFQRFNDNTLISKFIKNLLNDTPVPVYSVLSNGQYMYEGHKYIYKGYIIRCIKSGILDSSDMERGVYPSDNIYPSFIRYPGTGIYDNFARYQVIAFYKTPDKGSTFAHTTRSTSGVYDSETHEQLGRYLRFIRDIDHIDLMPYYNCYSNVTNDKVYIDTINGVIKEGTLVNYKVLSIPIRFNTTYTIALDSYEDLYYTTAILNNNGTLIKQNIPDTYNPTEELTENNILHKSSTTFLKPFLFTIHETVPRVLNFEDQLRLLIQIPSSNNSSIVVLEGDYTNNYHTYKCNDKGILIPQFVSTPALLRFNCRTSFAFTSKLTEYLLGNVIHNYSANSGNIERVQKLIANTFSEYKMSILSPQKESMWGVWDVPINENSDDLLTNYIKRLLNENKDLIDNYDYNTHVDSKLEALLYKISAAKAYNYGFVNSKVMYNSDTNWADIITHNATLSRDTRIKRQTITNNKDKYVYYIVPRKWLYKTTITVAEYTNNNDIEHHVWKRLCNAFVNNEEYIIYHKELAGTNNTEKYLYNKSVVY